MFTPREVARIQSFPENFKLAGSRTTNYKGLGNAVPPVMMWHITNSVIQTLRNNSSVLIHSDDYEATTPLGQLQLAIDI